MFRVMNHMFVILHNTSKLEDSCVFVSIYHCITFQPTFILEMIPTLRKHSVTFFEVTNVRETWTCVTKCLLEVQIFF